ncbi:unnamed protein product [Mytilus coruscus]|uniref:Uncharacterized protein n=1 Tax=Mytilus coruscus TaxID=42192 RepID=A0A6J8D2L2_MYTCO|nr:unnamed protein product [Mytilus coruscus]
MKPNSIFWTWYYLCIGLIFFYTCDISSATLIQLEAENSLLSQNNIDFKTIQIAEEKSLLVGSEEILNFYFCLSEDSNVTFKQVCGFHSGNMSQLQVSVDQSYISSFELPKMKSEVQFIPCVGMNFTINLLSGRHLLTLTKIDNDTDHFFIDNFQIHFPEIYITNSILQCSTICLERINLPKIQVNQLNSSVVGRIQNNNYNTMCAEVDNINIPIHHEQAKRYKVTAIHPAYHSFENTKIHDFKNCKQTESVIFSIRNFPLGQPLFSSNGIVLREARYLSRRTILLKFYMEGPIKDSVNSEIGSDIHLQVSPIKFNTDITFSFYGRTQRWISTSPITFSTDKLQHTWNVPDFTWSSTSPNYISFILPDNFTTTLIIKRLSIEKRQVRPDIPFKMFSNDRLILEGVDKDFWWPQNNDRMTVKVMETGKEFDYADYLRIYIPVPWNSINWCQIFVIYQDGNVRILPITPPGVDWIPFGSSLVVGETNPFSRRPYSAIRHIDFHAKQFRMDIYHYDGNNASLVLNSKMFETSMIIENFQFKRQSLLPVLTFRSMFVTEGNADCDHVNVDGKQDIRIQSNWTEVLGTTFFFYRKCISKHNTQSPDYLVEILE